MRQVNCKGSRLTLAKRLPDLSFDEDDACSTRVALRCPGQPGPFPSLDCSSSHSPRLLAWVARSAPPPVGIAFALALVPILFGTVFSAVHHAEVIAHRTGEPYGTLVLTVAVTIIEVALITSIMLTSDSSPALARDTVFAVVMIVCNGLVGLCILAGGL